MAKKNLPSRYEVERDMEDNRNHSWYREVYNIHSHELSRVVLKYMGTDITYGQFFRESLTWAKALKANGIKKGDEFVICMDRTPECTYLIGAASVIGAKIKLISEKFEPNFVKENIKLANSPVFFVQDVKLAKMKNILKELPDIKVVPISHKRSMNDKFPFLDILEKFYYLDKNEYDLAVKELSNIYDLDKFLESGKDYVGVVEEDSTLDDVFTITYSSGTTKKGFPKGIVHKNRHYILMGRYHDPEVSGIPAMKKMSTYSNVPVYSNSYVASSFSDNMIQGGVVVLDPVDAPEYFILGLKMYGSNLNIATTSTWLVNAINYYSKNESYQLKDAILNFAVGEQLSPGEEKFLNKYLKDTKAGINVTHTPFSVSKMCLAGGDCEHGSLFIRILRAYMSMNPTRANKKDPIGMSVYDFIDIKVLREDGTYALPYEYGRIVCNSGCTMKEYDRNPEGTRDFYVKDAYGNLWGDMNVCGYLDEKGNVTMKGRIEKDKNVVPGFMIADVIARDTKKIMSCDVVTVRENDKVSYVAHIMPQLNTTINYNKLLEGIYGRLNKEFFAEIVENIYVRFRSVNDYYPLTSCEKRDFKSLQQEGLNKAHHLNSLVLSKQNTTNLVRKKVKK